MGPYFEQKIKEHSCLEKNQREPAEVEQAIHTLVIVVGDLQDTSD